MLEEYLKKTEPEYYPPVENLLDLIYEHYTENNPVEKNTVAGKAAKAKEKELEEWLRGRVFLFFRLFSFFLLRCNFVAGVNRHAHADQRATSKILVSLHQFLAARVEAPCHAGKCAE